MPFIKFISFSLVIFLLSACEHSPTRLRSTSPTDIQALQASAKAPLKITKEVILIDARRAFDYSILHLPNAINLSWEEFSDHRGPIPGKLKDDPLSMSRRLARLGVTPDSKVIIVGYGREGKGEEGRLAWTLFYLGVKDVQFANMNYFKARMNQKQPQLNPQAIWTPRINKKVFVSEKEIKKTNRSVKWLDVRSSKQALLNPINNHSLKVPWNEFVNYKGRPDLKLKTKLNKIGLKPSDRILVVSEGGIRSATVVMSLLSMGFHNAANVPGGAKELKHLRRFQ